MSLKETATQTLQILEAGYFLSADGVRIEIEPGLSHAVNGTRLYTPEQLAGLMENVRSSSAVSENGLITRPIRDLQA
jgi:hypothetical protein